MMPRLDGYQTCALIKNNSVQVHAGDHAVVKDGLFDKAKGRIVGSDQFLTKPFSKEELLTRSRPMFRALPPFCRSKTLQ
jgi:twitching motility two-component system response regulator PilG